MAKKKPQPAEAWTLTGDYEGLLGDVVTLLETARRMSARAVNAVMTATYWEIGRRIVESEQGGEGRADYGQSLLKRLASDLTARFGRGFSDRSLYKMRLFYLSRADISPTLSAKSELQISPTLSAKSSDQVFQTVSAELPTTHPSSHIMAGNSMPAIQGVASLFPLPWSHYVKLLSVENAKARRFYEEEALRGGWSVRQLDRQISS